MRIALLLSVSFALATAPLAAQGPAHNLVTNGDFTGTLVPWVLAGGYSCTPQLDTTYATNGITVSDAFGCGPGGQVTPPPYPANTIEQTISVVSGTTYELRADVSSSRVNAGGTNVDSGTIWAEVNGAEVARLTFGSITITETKRGHLCGRFVGPLTGTVTLKISFQRAFLCNAGTPRVNIDNVSVEDVTGPTYCIVGNRKIGTTVSFSVTGEANAAYAAVIAAGEIVGGVSIPGFNGLWFLDFASATVLVSGTLDAGGNATTPILIPNNPSLRTVPLFHQALSVGSTNELGLSFGCVFTGA